MRGKCGGVTLLRRRRGCDQGILKDLVQKQSKKGLKNIELCRHYTEKELHWKKYFFKKFSVF